MINRATAVIVGVDLSVVACGVHQVCQGTIAVRNVNFKEMVVVVCLDVRATAVARVNVHYMLAHVWLKGSCNWRKRRWANVDAVSMLRIGIISVMEIVVHVSEVLVEAIEFLVFLSFESAFLFIKLLGHFKILRVLNLSALFGVYLTSIGRIRKFGDFFSLHDWGRSNNNWSRSRGLLCCFFNIFKNQFSRELVIEFF